MHNSLLEEMINIINNSELQYDYHKSKSKNLKAPANRVKKAMQSINQLVDRIKIEMDEVRKG